MERFSNGHTNILISTTVIEVGINVPNANVMVIESAERFGLSQLHQLRGRVGRGSDQSYCILMTSYKLSNVAKKRLEIMTSTNDGFQIANEDLRLRGPGDITGLQQSGVVNLKVADIIRDEGLFNITREESLKILKDDPHLRDEQHSMILSYIKSELKDTINLIQVG